jgi:hypothetical protein
LVTDIDTTLKAWFRSQGALPEKLEFYFNIPNENILANRVGTMLNLPDSSMNWIIVLLLTGIIGGLASGFSALAGFYAKDAMTGITRIKKLY